VKNEIIIFITRYFLYICHQMTIQNKRIFASILFVLISFVSASAQLPPPGPPPPVGLPIDGGVLFFAFVALFYGTKKIINK
jgi:hypothetical protein